MDPMQTPAHAKPARRDHLWVLVIIAGFAMYDVWGAWSQLGNKSGFAHGTGWTLTVIVEAYWAYALFAWFRAPGPRSRRFAMGSAVFVFVMSLAGQGSAHLTAGRMPPAAVVVFVSVLPVTVLMLIAVLIHLRQKDREEAAEVGERSSVQAEMDVLRVQVETLMSDLATAVTARADADRRESEALTRAENLAQKLAAKSAQGKRSKSARPDRKNAQADDITLEFRALDELQKDPKLRAPRMGAELGRRIGASPATGRRLHAKLTAHGRPGEPLNERSVDQSDERSDERS